MGTQLTHVVTGAAGFIGSHLVDKLLEQGHRVIGLDDLSLGTRLNLARAMTSTDFIFEALDLNDLAHFLEVLSAQHARQPVQTLWHLAANSDIQAGVTNSDVDLRRTFLTTYHVLRVMNKLRITEIVFASTSAIYGELDGALTETSGPLLPISSYGAMKLASEAIISAALEQFLKNCWILRFPNVVGPRATHGVIFDFMKKLRRNPLELEVLGNGNQEKPYLHVTELVEAMLFLQQRSRDRMNVFNIAPDGTSTTVRHIAEASVRATSPQANIRYTGGDRGWVGDVPKFRYSIARLKAAGWTPRLTSDQAVDLAIRENVGVCCE